MTDRWINLGQGLGNINQCSEKVQWTDCYLWLTEEFYDHGNMKTKMLSTVLLYDESSMIV